MTVSRLFARLIPAGFLLAGLLIAEPAAAACTDPPGPGVNWQRCVMDGITMTGVDLSGARLRDTSFFRSDLSGADLSKVSGYRSKYVNADMTGKSHLSAIQTTFNSSLHDAIKLVPAEVQVATNSRKACLPQPVDYDGFKHGREARTCFAPWHRYLVHTML